MQPETILDSDLPEGYRETELGLLPKEWEIVQLGDLATRLKAGGTPKRGVATYWNGDIPFAKIEDITRRQGQIFDTKERITEEGLTSSSAWIVPRDSVLLSMYASIGETAINRIPLATNQAIAAILPDRTRVGEEYLFFALKYFGKKLISYSIQSTQKNVNKGIVEQFSIPLPPLSEQGVIAQILRTIQKSIETTEKVIEASRELKRSLMNHLFTYGPVRVDEAEQVPLQETEIGPVPEHWKTRRCEFLCTRISVGVVVKPSSYYVPFGVPAFRSFNVREDLLAATNLVYFSEQANENKLSKSKLEAGDVLIVRTGNPGTSCVVPPEFEGSNCIDLVFARPKISLILSGYLSRFFNSSGGRQQALAAKTGLAQQHLNVSAVKRTLVPLPPLEEQNAIVDSLSALDRKVGIEVNRKRTLEALFKTLLHNLMTGKVRVGDPNVSELEEIVR